MKHHQHRSRIVDLVGLFVLLAALPFPVSARAKRPHKKAAPPPPIQVVLRAPAGDKANPVQQRAANPLHLEPGAYTNSTDGIDAGEAARNREKYLLLATEAVEGGFDAVNLYDRGIVSWGLMQWTAHQNSLQEALWYVKGRLLDKRRGRVWANLFKAQGLDVQSGPGGAPAFFVGGPTAWRPVVGEENLRVVFRGTRVVGCYDVPTITRWAKIFARAGRNPTVQSIQVEWATQRLRACLNERVDGTWRVRDFARGDVFSDALTFALWTNNPAAARRHFRQAVRTSRRVSGEADPARWPPGLFPLLWEQTARASSFPGWPRRAARIAQLIPVGKKGRDRASMELASRGWRLSDLKRGGGTGRLWRREPKPKPAVAKPKPVAAKPAVPAKPAPATPPPAVSGAPKPGP